MCELRSFCSPGVSVPASTIHSWEGQLTSCLLCAFMWCIFMHNWPGPCLYFYWFFSCINIGSHGDMRGHRGVSDGQRGIKGRGYRA